MRNLSMTLFLNDFVGESATGLSATGAQGYLPMMRLMCASWPRIASGRCRCVIEPRYCVLIPSAAATTKGTDLPSAGRLVAVGWGQNTPEAAGFASSAAVTCANAFPGGVAFNFTLRRLTSETTAVSARSQDTVGFGAGYFDLSPSMGPFEYDNSGRSGIYWKTEAGKGHYEDNEFPHLGSPWVAANSFRDIRGFPAWARHIRWH